MLTELMSRIQIANSNICGPRNSISLSGTILCELLGQDGQCSWCLGVGVYVFAVGIGGYDAVDQNSDSR